MADPKPAPKPTDWRTLHLWQIQPVRDGLIILAALGLLWLGKMLSVVTVPMLLALLLAYLCEPLVRRLTRGRLISRQGAAVGLVVLAAGLVVLPVGMGLGFAALQGATYAQRVAINAQQLVETVRNPTDAAGRAALPGPWQRAADKLIELRKRADRVRDGRGTPSAADAPAATGTRGAEAGAGFEPLPTVAGVSEDDLRAAHIYRLAESAISWLQANAAQVSRQAFATGAGAVELGLRWVLGFATVVFGLFLTAFFFYFFCTGYGRLLHFWESLIPERKRGRVVELARKMDVVTSGFVRGRLIICSLLGVYYTLGYWLIGAPAPLILGPIVGALTIIPYAAGIAAPLVVGLMWLEPPGAGWQATWWWITFAPLGVAVGQQMLDDYFLTPRIQGETTGMDTPTILFASLAGGLLAGVYGLLVAIPVAACLRIVVREVVWPQFKAWAEGKADDPLPIAKG